MATIFVESMEPTFKGKGDSMPPGYLYGWRSKLIHSVGVVGSVVFKPSDRYPHYSGIFRGADRGLIRLSAATSVSTGKDVYKPGMGLKFLRDGVDSANLVSMFAIDG